MKIAVATTFALAAAQKEKKVPPRHPTQRLNKLGVFYANFFEEMVSEGIMKQGEADRRAERAASFIANMGAAFARDNCGYYSGEGKHGGPDPNPEINFNGKPRNRRTADNEDDLLEAATEWCAEEVQDGYFIGGAYTDQSEANWAECCQLSSEFCDGRQPRSGAGANQKAYDRLSTNIPLKWKQITTGTRKWAQRYINNCHGQRKYQLASKRANKMYKNVYNKYFA